MTVRQVYLFNISTEAINGALATDGSKVQYLTPGTGADDAQNRERAMHAERMLDLAKGPDGTRPVENPFTVIAGNVMALVTNPFEFPDFNAAAAAAQALFYRGAVAGEFAV